MSIHVYFTDALGCTNNNLTYTFSPISDHVLNLNYEHIIIISICIKGECFLWCWCVHRTLLSNTVKAHFICKVLFLVMFTNLLSRELKLSLKFIKFN